jgi:hypothetical protein
MQAGIPNFFLKWDNDLYIAGVAYIITLKDTEYILYFYNVLNFAYFTN